MRSYGLSIVLLFAALATGCGHKVTGWSLNVGNATDPIAHLTIKSVEAEVTVKQGAQLTVSSMSAGVNPFAIAGVFAPSSDTPEGP